MGNAAAMVEAMDAHRSTSPSPRLRRLVRRHLDFQRAPEEIARSLGEELRKKGWVPLTPSWSRTFLVLIVVAGLARSSGDLDAAARLISEYVADASPLVQMRRAD